MLNFTSLLGVQGFIICLCYSQKTSSTSVSFRNLNLRLSLRMIYTLVIVMHVMYLNLTSILLTTLLDSRKKQRCMIQLVQIILLLREKKQSRRLSYIIPYMVRKYLLHSLVLYFLDCLRFLTSVNQLICFTKVSQMLHLPMYLMT